MRIVVTGRHGQFVSALAETAPAHGIEIQPLARPEVDLSRLETLAAALDRAAPDVVVNAAAYTAVDKAECDQDAALLINGAAAGALAAACAKRGVPIIQLSTDYVFDGAKVVPYIETDTTSPLNVYGASKLLGEQLVVSANPRNLIVRTSWVVSPFGQNFVRTMLRLRTERDTVSVVDDQHGAPTYAPHLAAAVLNLAARMVASPTADPRWGVYHATNQGETTWCGVARAIFDRCASAHGLRVPTVTAISTSGYPTPARRPANSRLDNAKMRATFSLALPDWQQGIAMCVDRILAGSAN